jgi:membrane protein implicated in regulation of membrane protease activity
VRDARIAQRWPTLAAVAVAAAVTPVVFLPVSIIAAPSVGGVPAGAYAALAAAALALFAAPLVALAWHYWRAPSRMIDDLERRVAQLEQAASASPSPRLRFEHETTTWQALLHVTNDGEDAEFWAPLIIDGSLSRAIDGRTFATWTHTPAPKTLIARGRTRTLRLAQLDLSIFPFAQWQVYAIGDDTSPVVLRAMHTSVIGNAPDAHATPIFLEVSILSTPDSRDHAQGCTIALYPFAAERLRP